MSERYECVLVSGLNDQVTRAFEELVTPLPINLGTLGDDLFAVYVTEGRLIRHLDVEQIAINLSAKFGRALLVIYDNSCDVCLAALYGTGGILERQFGEEDEVWVPFVLDEHGRLVADGDRLRRAEIEEDDEGEYDCIFDAIDAGLQAFGVRDRFDRTSLKQKVVYDFDY